MAVHVKGSYISHYKNDYLLLTKMSSLLDLPSDIISFEIFCHLDNWSLFILRQTCRPLRELYSNLKTNTKVKKMSLINYSALKGYSSVLRFAHENVPIGTPWNKLTCENAARAGSIECLKYLHEN